jgi:hypothetical protein
MGEYNRMRLFKKEPESDQSAAPANQETRLRRLRVTINAPNHNEKVKKKKSTIADKTWRKETSIYEDAPSISSAQFKSLATPLHNIPFDATFSDSWTLTGDGKLKWD